MYPNAKQHRTHAVGIFQLSFVVFEKSGNNILTYRQTDIHTDRRNQNIILDTRGCPFKFERGKALTRVLRDTNFTICFGFFLFCFVFVFVLFNSATRRVSMTARRFYCPIIQQCKPRLDSEHLSVCFS